MRDRGTAESEEPDGRLPAKTQGCRSRSSRSLAELIEAVQERQRPTQFELQAVKKSAGVVARRGQATRRGRQATPRPATQAGQPGSDQPAKESTDRLGKSEVRRPDARRDQRPAERRLGPTAAAHARANAAVAARAIPAQVRTADRKILQTAGRTAEPEAIMLVADCSRVAIVPVSTHQRSDRRMTLDRHTRRTFLARGMSAAGARCVACAAGPTPRPSDPEKSAVDLITPAAGPGDRSRAGAAGQPRKTKTARSAPAATAATWPSAAWPAWRSWPPAARPAADPTAATSNVASTSSWPTRRKAASSTCPAPAATGRCTATASPRCFWPSATA